MRPSGETETSLKKALSGTGKVLNNLATSATSNNNTKSKSSFKGLNDYLSSNSSVNNDDVLNVKKTLLDLGHYKPNERIGETSSNLSKYPDTVFFDAIKTFQKDNGLTVDGIMKKGGETEKALVRNLIEPSKEEKERLQKAGLYDKVKFMNKDTSNENSSNKDESQETKASSEQTQKETENNTQSPETKDQDAPKEIQNNDMQTKEQGTSKIVDKFVKNMSEKHDIKDKNTLETLKGFARKYIESYRIFEDQKKLMEKENIAGNDKFNHCEANRKVTGKGNIHHAAALSVIKEAVDIGDKWDKIPLKESLKDSLEDLEADLHGIGYGINDAFKKLLELEITENGYSKYDKRNNKQNLKK